MKNSFTIIALGSETKNIYQSMKLKIGKTVNFSPNKKNNQ